MSTKRDSGPSKKRRVIQNPTRLMLQNARISTGWSEHITEGGETRTYQWRRLGEYTPRSPERVPPDEFFGFSVYKKWEHQRIELDRKLRLNMEHWNSEFLKLKDELETARLQFEMCHKFLMETRQKVEDLERENQLLWERTSGLPPGDHHSALGGAETQSSRCQNFSEEK